MRKVLLPVFFAFLVVTASAWPARRSAETLAITPPMGWNSWDSWGFTINQDQFKQTVLWLHDHLQQYGYQYVIIDEGWFARQPEKPAAEEEYTISDHGLYMPAVNRFPSAADGKGFAPLAAWVHSLGLKFGIHIVHGIPRSVVEKNERIAHSRFTAAEAANTSDTCRWNSDNYGVKDNKAGQAYYDAMADLYASWGVDFLKVDCISQPWNGPEIRMIRKALDQSGRPIALSLSPGPTPLADGAEAAKEAQQWRISDDVWDVWDSGPKAPQFPQSIRNQFALVAKWEPFAGPGHWPDADMLPIGYLGPHPGWGQPRHTRLTNTEVRTQFTLWSIGRSPLILGANLLKMDAATDDIISNPEVIAVDQYSENNRQVIRDEDSVVWMASAPEHKGDYIAIFNISNEPKTMTYSWRQLGITYGACPVRDLWQRKEIGTRKGITVTLAPHASALYLAQHP
jgi:hypothetical protein